jgi:hypothetical protein
MEEFMERRKSLAARQPSQPSQQHPTNTQPNKVCFKKGHKILLRLI